MDVICKCHRFWARGFNFNIHPASGGTLQKSFCFRGRCPYIRFQKSRGFDRATTGTVGRASRILPLLPAAATQEGQSAAAAPAGGGGCDGGHSCARADQLGLGPGGAGGHAGPAAVGRRLLAVQRGGGSPAPAHAGALLRHGAPPAHPLLQVRSSCRGLAGTWDTTCTSLHTPGGWKEPFCNRHVEPLPPARAVGCSRTVAVLQRGCLRALRHCGA